MTTGDTQLDTGQERALVTDWYISSWRERTALQSVVASLSSESLADEDIREHLQSRLRAIEDQQNAWHVLALAGLVRRDWTAIGRAASKPWGYSR